MPAEGTQWPMYLSRRDSVDSRPEAAPHTALVCPCGRCAEHLTRASFSDVLLPYRTAVHVLDPRDRRGRLRRPPARELMPERSTPHSRNGLHSCVRDLALAGGSLP